MPDGYNDIEQTAGAGGYPDGRVAIVTLGPVTDEHGNEGGYEVVAAPVAEDGTVDYGHAFETVECATREEADAAARGLGEAYAEAGRDRVDTGAEAGQAAGADGREETGISPDSADISGLDVLQETRIETNYGLADITTVAYEDHGEIRELTVVTLDENAGMGGTGAGAPFTIQAGFEGHETAVNMVKDPDNLATTLENRLFEAMDNPYGTSEAYREVRWEMSEMADAQGDRLEALGRVPGVEVETRITDDMRHEVGVEGGTVVLEGVPGMPGEQNEGVRVTFEGEDGTARELGTIECGPDGAARLESAFISHDDSPSFLVRMEDHPGRMADIASGLDPDSVPEAVIDISQSGTIDDLRELLGPYLNIDEKDLDTVCGLAMEAAEEGKLSGDFDPEFLSSVLDDVSEEPSLTDEGKEELSGIVIGEAVFNPDFKSECGGLDYLASSGDIDGTLDAINLAGIAFSRNESLPQELSDRVSDFFGALADEYKTEMNDNIYDAVENALDSYADGSESMSGIDAMIENAFPGGSGLDDRLQDIQEIIKEYRWEDCEGSRDEAVGLIAEKLEDYREGREADVDPAGMEAGSDDVDISEDSLEEAWDDVDDDSWDGVD